MVHELFNPADLDPLEEVIDRLLEIEQEAFPNADCIPFFFHAQESFPYFTHRYGDITPEVLSSQHYVDSYTIVVRIVVAHLEEGYDGQGEVEVYRLLRGLIRMFLKRPTLKSLAYPEAMLNLSPDGIELQEVRGLSVFEDGGVGADGQVAKQVGTEITLLVPFIDDIEEDM